MIYPALRISDLERDVHDKRLQLDASRNGLRFLIRQKLQPVTFIQENRDLLIGGFLTIFPFIALLGKALAGKNKGGFLWKALSFGWLWKLIQLSGGIIKTATWLTKTLARVV